MNVVIAGGTGFIGSFVASRLSQEGIAVTVLTRRVKADSLPQEGGVRYVGWDGMSIDGWSRVIDGADCVVNLAGELVGSNRWTAARKRRILSSRLEPTSAIVQVISAARQKPSVLVSMSAVGYYGAVEEGVATEVHARGAGFLADVCEVWERKAQMAEGSGVRVVILRSGVVLGKEGGALPRMVLPFRFFAGGVVGSGQQCLPWVHPLDLVEVILFAVANPAIKGAVNVVAPQIVTMREFAAAIGEVLRRSVWAPVPEWVLRLVFGEMAEMVLTGQRVVPEVLQQAGFMFRYPDLRSALQDILQ